MGLFSYFRAIIGGTKDVRLLRLRRVAAVEARRAGSVAASYALAHFWVCRVKEIAVAMAPASGSFEGVLSEDELELALEWRGKRGALIGAMVDAGIMQRRPLRLSDWQIEQEPLARKARQHEPREPRRERDTIPDKTSPEFDRYWDLLPSRGWKSSTPRTYRIWLDLGLDMQSPEAEATRKEIYRALQAQRNDDDWLAHNKNSNSRTYLKNRMWAGYFRRPTPAAPIVVDDRTVPATLIDPPQRPDEKDRDETKADPDLVRQWRAIGQNKVRQWPGETQAWRDISAHRHGGQSPESN